MEIPRIATGIYIFNEEGKLLLFKMEKWAGKWSICGGKLDYGETIEECAHREVKEETNLEIKDLELLKIEEAINPKEFYKPAHFVFFIYKCKIKSGELIKNEELGEHKWVTLEEAKEMNTNVYVKEMIEEMLQNKDKL